MLYNYDHEKLISSSHGKSFDEKKKTVRIGIGQDTTSSNILFDGSRKIISKPEEVK